MREGYGETGVPYTKHFKPQRPSADGYGWQGKRQPEDRPGKQVPRWAVYSLLMLTQASFSIGAAYLKYSLRSSGEQLQPVVFALCREALAAPPLLLMGRIKSGSLLPPRADAGRFLQIGGLLYLNQLLFIWGLHLSGVVMATCIQPFIPVVTVGLAVMLGLETGSVRKLAGIILAVGGAVCMVVGGSMGSSGGSQGFSGAALVGNACLTCNCLSASCFYIAVKNTTARFHPSSITAWAYSSASVLMAATALVTVPPDKWALPSHALGPLAYWVLVCSVVGYYVLTWASGILPASHVAASQCLQPFAGTALGWALLGERVTAWDAGAVAILVGLGCVVSDKSPDPPGSLPPKHLLLPASGNDGAASSLPLRLQAKAAASRFNDMAVGLGGSSGSVDLTMVALALDGLQIQQQPSRRAQERFKSLSP